MRLVSLHDLQQPKQPDSSLSPTGPLLVHVRLQDSWPVHLLARELGLRCFMVFLWQGPHPLKPQQIMYVGKKRMPVSSKDI